MNSVLEQLFRSPRLPQYARSIEDRLNAERAAREKFYDDLRDDVKAEFINGEVFMHSPVKLEHNDASKLPFILINTFVTSRKLGKVGHEKLLIALTRNDYEPDICFWSTAKSSSFTAKQMKFPAPDLIVEVLSPTTAEHDRGVKFQDYADHGVTEYWILDPEMKTVEQYLLDAGEYRLHFKANAGSIHSVAIEGFSAPVEAMFDEQANLAALREMLKTA